MTSQTVYGPSAKGDRLATGLIVTVVAIILIGFAKNFYLRPWLGTRPLTTLAYVHGTLMSAWILLFILQVVLISGRRTALHRKLGEWGAGIALLIVTVGVLTIAAAARRHHETASIGRFLAVFIAYDGLSLILFGALVGCAILFRRQPTVHRRLMLIAMVALLPPAFGRLLAYGLHEHVEVIVLAAMAAVVVICLLVDAWKTGRPHRAVVIPAIAIVAVNAATYLAQIWT
jgi:hypothetical protein